MNYPTRTIPPYVRPYEDSSLTQADSHHQHPQSYWSSFVTPFDLKGRVLITPDQRAAFEAEQAAKEHAREALQHASASGPRASALVRAGRRIDNVLRHSIWWLLMIRLLVFAFSATALGLAGGMRRRSRALACAGARDEPSSLIALVVNAASLVYTAALMWDEVTSKPINERSFQARLAITAADVLAITFNAANLAVAFYLITDPRWFCHRGQGCPYDYQACADQEALVSVLCCVQICWIAALYTSLYRIASKMGAFEGRRLRRTVV